MNFVALSSSRGTTLQAVLDAMAKGSLKMQCLGLITDDPSRACINKAESAGIPVQIVQKKAGDTKVGYENRLSEALYTLGATNDETVIAALGWMFIFSPWFIDEWSGHIINVHPALLPKFGGVGMYGNRVHETVLASGETESGISIHVMDHGVDTGKILVQQSCSVMPDDTVESLKERVQELEKEWYPRALQMIEDGTVTL
ncbi:MAG: phosphoribosylglycinamide formyltransferase [bacterium]|nr:phosphoribosylglycinamide formyltransferase [bacterium]